MFAELLLPSGLSVDRDEVEQAIVDALGADVEVTGAGGGLGVVNLDLELSGDLDAHTATIRDIVHGLGIVGAKLRREGQPSIDL